MIAKATRFYHNTNPVRKYTMKKNLNIICKLTGHDWRYKDYTNWMKENGDNYDFKASRFCSRCNQIEYLYSVWVGSDQKLPHDVEIDAFAVKQFQANFN